MTRWETQEEDDDWRAMEAKENSYAASLAVWVNCVFGIIVLRMRILASSLFCMSSAKDDEDEGAVFSAASSCFPRFFLFDAKLGNEERV
jgi:hypothetical protein